MNDLMYDFWLASGVWSTNTFGPIQFRGPNGPLEHLKKEAQEAIDAVGLDEKDEEIVDCLFLTFDAARRNGMGYNQLISLAFKKLEKNKQRSWPDWREADVDKPIEHNK